LLEDIRFYNDKQLYFLYFCTRYFYFKKILLWHFGDDWFWQQGQWICKHIELWNNTRKT